MLQAEKTSLRSWFSSGEIWIWMNAAAVGISIAAVVGLLGLIAVRGLAHFWPADIAAITYTADGGGSAIALGELVEHEALVLDQYRDATGDETAFPADVDQAQLKLAMLEFVNGSTKTVKHHSEHVREGSRSGKSWETEIPVTDPHSLRAEQRRNRGRGGRPGPPGGR